MNHPRRIPPTDAHPIPQVRADLKRAEVRLPLYELRAVREGGVVAVPKRRPLRWLTGALAWVWRYVQTGIAVVAFAGYCLWCAVTGRRL